MKVSGKQDQTVLLLIERNFERHASEGSSPLYHCPHRFEFPDFVTEPRLHYCCAWNVDLTVETQRLREYPEIDTDELLRQIPEQIRKNIPELEAGAGEEASPRQHS